MTQMLWLTEERRERICAAARSENERWGWVREHADAGLSVDADRWDYIPALCVAYQACGNAAYASAALDLALNMAQPENTLAEDHGYFLREVIPAIAMALSWANGSDQTRLQLATWLLDRADWIWPETNPVRADAWGMGAPGGNYWSGFLMSWVAGLAALGISPELDARAHRHIEMGKQKFLDEFVRWAETLGKGGVFPEGTNYDSTFRIAQILDAHYTVTGQNFFEMPGFTFLEDSLSWRLASTAPNMLDVYPLGDQARQSRPQIWDMDRMRALIPSAHSPRRGQINDWLDSQDPPICRSWFGAPWELLFYQPDEWNKAQAVEEVFFAEGPGLLTYKRGDYYWGIACGPIRDAHQSMANNSLLVWYRGEWILPNAQQFSQSGCVPDTWAHNTAMFWLDSGGDPCGQCAQEPDAQWAREAGEVTQIMHGDGWAYFAGQTAQAYTADREHDGQPVVSDFLRRVLYTHPGRFIIYDRVMAAQPGQIKNWQINWQTPERASLMGRGYWWSTDTGFLYGQALLSESVSFEVLPVQLGDGGQTSSYRLAVDMRTRPYALNVLRVGDVPQAHSAIEDACLINVLRGAVDGAIVHDTVAVFPKEDALPPDLEYSGYSMHETQHFLIGPEGPYQISVNGLVFQSVRGVPTEPIRFSVPAGNWTVKAERVSG